MNYYNSVQYTDLDKNNPKPSPLSDGSFIGRVMRWLFLAFAAAAAGIFFLGPLVPETLMMPLYLITLGVLVISAFARKSNAFAPVFVVAVPTILGIILYPTLNMYVSSGAGDIVFMAAAGTALVFGLMAFLGWTSKRSLESWSGRLFMILLAVIGLSLLNVFIFKLSIISLLISAAALVIFSIYTFIDIQRLRDRSEYDMTHPAVYALNIFLDIWNIFVSLLNILSYFR